MERGMTKQQLVDELAKQAGISKARCLKVLDALVETACREAPKGFNIPGLCHLEVVTRKGRIGRNPRTGSKLWIGPRKGLKITPLKKARDKIAPSHEHVVTVMEEESASVPAFSLITFSCTACGVEIEASSDLIGSKTACPACQAQIVVPAETSSEPASVLFQCAACKAEIEAPAHAIGQQVLCPACGAPLRIPTRQTAETAATSLAQNFDGASSRTMRIELPPQSAPAAPPPSERKIVIRRSALSESAAT